MIIINFAVKDVKKIILLNYKNQRQLLVNLDIENNNKKEKIGEIGNMQRNTIYNPSCEVKHNEDSMPEKLKGEYMHSCPTLEGNTKIPSFRLGLEKTKWHLGKTGEKIMGDRLI